MGIKDHENSFRPDIESLRTGMISALDKYLHDFGSQMRAQDRYSLKVQRLLSSADKIKLFKIDEDGHALFLFVLKGKTQVMKATTLEQLQYTFDTISAEVKERYKQLRSSSVGGGVNQFGKQMLEFFIQMSSLLPRK